MIISNSYEHLDNRRQEAFFRALNEWWANGRPEIHSGILNDTRFVDELVEKCLYPALLKRLPPYLRIYYAKKRAKEEEALPAIRLTLFERPYIYIEQIGVGGAINYFARAAYFKVINEYRDKQKQPVSWDPDIHTPGTGVPKDNPLLFFFARILTGDAPILDKKGVVITLLKDMGISENEIVKALEGHGGDKDSREWHLLLNYYFPNNPIAVDWSTVVLWFETPPPPLNQRSINRFFIRFVQFLNDKHNPHNW